MKKIKKMQAQGFYILEGNASANSLFFEDFEEMEHFQILANRYLSKYMRIMEYCLKPEGWKLVVRIKDPRTIKSNFTKFTNSERKLKITKIWEMLSEIIRIWQHQFVKWSNRKKGRTGSLVGNPYKRYYFDSSQEALDEIQDIRDEKIDVGQNLVQFRPDLSTFDKDDKIKINSWVSASKMAQSKLIVLQKIGLKCLYLWEVSDFLLQKFVAKTHEIHNLK